VVSAWTIETKLPRNDHWKVLYKVCVFYADRKSKMATTAGQFVKDLPMIDAQFRFNQCNSFREEDISVFPQYID
jgi:hypothetical protein